MQDLSPLMLVVLAVGVAVSLVGAMASRRFGFLLLAGMMVAGFYAPYVNDFGHVTPTWLTPIQVHRSSIFLGFGLLLLAYLVFHPSMLNLRNGPAPMYCIFLIGVYQGVIRLVHEGPQSGVLSVAFAGLTLTPLLFAPAGAVQDERDVLRVLRWVMFGMLGYIATVAVQFVINKDVMNSPPNYRFAGLSGNPQSAAIVFAATILITLWLFFYDPSRRLRLLWAGMLGLQLVLLAWTGSRTGLGMVVVGLTVFLHRRFGRAVLFLPVAALAAYGIYEFLSSSGVEIQAERLMSLENTRGASWARMWQAFLAAPLVGVGFEQGQGSENSYLYALGTSGIVMGALVLLLVAVSGVSALRLWRVRRFLSPQMKTTADLVLSYYAMYFAGAMFEGFILARVGVHLVLFAIFTAIAMRLLEWATTSAWAWEGQYLETADESYDGESEGEDLPEGALPA